jgi:hypothetical protein
MHVLISFFHFFAINRHYLAIIIIKGSFNNTDSLYDNKEFSVITDDNGNIQGGIE